MGKIEKRTDEYKKRPIENTEENLPLDRLPNHEMSFKISGK